MRPPSVDALARSLADLGLPHPLLVDAARAAIATGRPETARERAEELAWRLLRPVINATGVLLHTNLGRAPLNPAWLRPPDAWRAHNVEFDLLTGRRGSRQAHAARLAAAACGAEAAIVVNNGAAAALLALTAVAAGEAVAVSRGELVEIGGGFRIPEVLSASGARLVEVGTTNRTRLADYRQALDAGARVILKVHQSNFRTVGFTEEVDVPALAELGIPVICDLGSGLLDATAPWLSGPPPAWLAREPAVRQTLAAGADLVTFSGDKLLGGPQAGVVAGRADLVDRCARHPLARALRPGGLTLALLQEVFLAYLARDGRSIPLWRMITTPVSELWARASALDVGEVVHSTSVVGGGSLPGVELESAAVALPGDHRQTLARRPLPVVTRTERGRTLADLRSVDPADDEAVADALRSLAEGRRPPLSPDGPAEAPLRNRPVGNRPPGSTEP